ncbi:hypothetical protein [Priestia flexa]|uniref:hypothetical protein n=1 Tax=Priestia flexa TaxID=86664 RepID=UPI001B3228D4|nr:hypothetical protein [Priestia flexa]
MLNQNSIRNMTKSEFYPFLESLGYKNVRNLIKGKTNNDFYNLEMFLRNELTKSDAKLNKDNLDSFLYSKFFFEINHYHYVYKLSSILGKKDDFSIELKDLLPYLSSTPELKLNSNLVNIECKEQYSLCSTRYSSVTKNEKVYIDRIQFLFFINEIETIKGIVNFFCCVDLDLQSKFISFKFNSSVLENYTYSLDIVNTLLKTLTNDKGIFKDLEVVSESYNQSDARKTIQKLFMDLSQQAEKILRDKADPNIKKHVMNFLDTIKVPNSQEYINQIISVVYQNISKEFNKTLFNDGWVFRFVFKEGDNTRASSSTDEFEPVYSKKVYWNLKELMFKRQGTDFIEGGFYWLTKKGLEPVAVKIEQKNNLIIMQYYKQDFNNKNRKEKEAFVLRKFRRAIPKKS